VTPAQLEQALIEQLQLREQGTHILLGQILVRNGWLRTPILEEILSRQRTEFYGKVGE